MAAPTRDEVQIPALLAHQVGIGQSPARFKVVRAGRRFGKTVLAFHCAMIGHGPTDPHGDPMFPGIAQGGDVVWVARDYPQASIIWREEIAPRLTGARGVALNHSAHDVRVEGRGNLLVRSAENIASIRGIGKNLNGVVCEEAAWFDLGQALRDVVMPALLDNDGWLLLISTTNGGQDGNPEKIAPSYFNRLCLEIMGGQRSEEWAHFHGTARDNPKIGPARLEQLLAEYPPGSVSAAQEVEAELVHGGAGLAFPEWEPAVHVVSYEAPQDWGWVGGLDWGYESPGCFLLGRPEADREVLIRDEYYFRKQSAPEVGHQIGALLSKYAFEPGFPIFTDPSVFSPLDGRETYAEGVQRGLGEKLRDRAPVLVPASMTRTDGKTPRAAGKLLLHEYLRWEKLEGVELAKLPRHLLPRLRIHRACANLARTLPMLPLDEHNIEDVDTDAEDHAYDALRYLLQSRVPRPDRVAPPLKAHQHPGFTADGRRAPRFREPEAPPRFRTGFKITRED